MSEKEVNKILFMGLSVAGKSSIYSVVFEGKNPKEVQNYDATQNYVRSGHEILRDNFEIFDLGGQESFLSIFLGDMAEFIFSNVLVLIWVTDVSDSEYVSTSKYYFDKAMEKINQYSKSALIFCLFHKMDKIKDDFKVNVVENMESYFKPQHESRNIFYFPTTIYDKTVFEAMGSVIIELMKKSKKKTNLRNEIKTLLNKNLHLLGVMIFTNNCLPILKEGKQLENLFITANLFCSSFNQYQTNMGNQFNINCKFETDDYIYVFYKYDRETLATTIFDKKISLGEIENGRKELNEAIKSAFIS